MKLAYSFIQKEIFFLGCVPPSAPLFEALDHISTDVNRLASGVVVTCGYNNSKQRFFGTVRKFLGKQSNIVSDNKSSVGDHVGNSDLFCTRHCRYCYAPRQQLSKLKPGQTQVLRDPLEYTDIVDMVTLYTLGGKGFQKHAENVRKQYNVTGYLVCTLCSMSVY